MFLKIIPPGGLFFWTFGFKISEIHIFEAYMKRTEIDFTTGRIYSKIIRFIIPIIGAYLIQQAYSSADLIFAGNRLGKMASAAIGSSNLIVVMAIGLCGGLSVGTGILFSKAFGARDRAAQRRIGSVVLLLSIIFGSVLTVTGIFISKPVLLLMNTPLEIVDMAVGYIRIYFLSLVPMMIFNMTAGILRGTGNSLTPMIFQTISGGLNVFLDWLFLSIFPDGIEGVAWATVISQSLAAICTYVYFRAGDKALWTESEEEKDGKVDEKDVPAATGDIVKRIFSLGIPVGLQSMLVTLSNVFIQTNINSLGIDSMAAFTAYFKVELFMYYPIMSIGQAALFFTGQNLGAKRYERVRTSIAAAIKLGIPVIGIIGAFIFFFGSPLYRIFNPEPEVIKLGMDIMHVTAPFYWTYVIYEVLSNAIRSCGKTKTAMMVTLLLFAGARAGLLILYNLTGFLNIFSVASVYPITWIAASVTFIIIWRRTKNANCKIENEKTAEI